MYHWLLWSIFILIIIGLIIGFIAVANAQKSWTDLTKRGSTIGLFLFCMLLFFITFILLFIYMLSMSGCISIACGSSRNPYTPASGGMPSAQYNPYAPAYASQLPPGVVPLQ